MAGFTFSDRQNSVLFEASIQLNTIYPATLHINVIPFVNGKYDRRSSAWIPLRPNDMLKLYQNLVDPNSYGVVTVNLGKQTSSVGYVGGVLQVVTPRVSYNVNIDQMTLQSFSMYLNNWVNNAGVYKDLFESLSINTASIVKTAIMDVCSQLNIALQHDVKTLPTPTENNKSANSNRNNYNSQFSGNVGQVQQHSMMENTAPQMPNLGGFNAQSNAQPPRMDSQFQQQPQMTIPQPQQIPMGIPINQSPNGQAQNAMDDNVDNLLNGIFGGNAPGNLG